MAETRWRTPFAAGSFSSAAYLAKAIQKSRGGGGGGGGNDIYKKTKKDLEKSVLFQAHRDSRQHFLKRSDAVTSFGEKFEGDVGDLGSKFPLELIGRRLPQAGKRRQLLFLVVVDVFTRKAFARGLETKSGEEITASLKSICDGLDPENERFPLEFEFDSGREFDNEKVRLFCKENGAKFTLAKGMNKARMAERMIRSMKRIIMAAVQSGQLSGNWNDIVEKAAESLNHRYNRDIKMTPSEAERHSTILQKRAWKRKRVTPYELYLKQEKDIREGRGFKENDVVWRLGDTVLIPIPKIRQGSIRDKEFQIHYELIPKRIATIYHEETPALFRVKDARTGKNIARLYYAKELRKVSLPSTVDLAKIVSARVERGKGLVYREADGRAIYV